MNHRQANCIDQVYECQIAGQLFGMWPLRCRLQIYLPHPEQQTVIISDPQFQTGSFIPYRMEDLATQIVQVFELDPALVTWIEHYSDAVPRPSIPDFSRVTFRWRNGVASFPVWQPLTHAIAQALAGAPLPPPHSVCRAS